LEGQKLVDRNIAKGISEANNISNVEMPSLDDAPLECRIAGGKDHT
jgi:hypothetical protein